MDEARRALVRRLNDRLRRQQRDGRIMITAGVHALGAEFLEAALKAVAAFEHFDADNDPYNEHDCAGLTVAGHRLLFKIDYYDTSLTAGSPDPANPEVTTRVLTVMLAEEY
jgi:hypothetical protein